MGNIALLVRSSLESGVLPLVVEILVMFVPSARRQAVLPRMVTTVRRLVVMLSWRSAQVP